MSRFSPTVLPEYYGPENPGADIARALRQGALDRMAKEKQDVELAGEREQLRHDKATNPILEAVGNLHARQSGVVLNEDEDPDAVARYLSPPAAAPPRQEAPAAPAPESAETPLNPPAIRRAGGGWHEMTEGTEDGSQTPIHETMVGAYDPVAGVHRSALPMAGARDVAGVIAAGLLRAPVEAATGRVGHTPTHEVTHPRSTNGRVPLGGGYAFDPAVAESFRHPTAEADSAALEGIMPAGTAGYFSRHPDQVDNVLVAAIQAQASADRQDAADWQTLARPGMTAILVNRRSGKTRPINDEGGRPVRVPFAPASTPPVARSAPLTATQSKRVRDLVQHYSTSPGGTAVDHTAAQRRAIQDAVDEGTISEVQADVIRSAGSGTGRSTGPSSDRNAQVSQQRADWDALPGTREEKTRQVGPRP